MQFLNLFDNLLQNNKKCIKLTLRVFNSSKYKTLSLLDYKNDLKQKELTLKLNTLRDNYGIDIIKNGNELIDTKEKNAF